MAHPDRSEYVDHYHQYVGKVPEGDIVGTLESQLDEIVPRLRAVPEERGDHRYAEGKWTVKVADLASGVVGEAGFEVK